MELSSKTIKRMLLAGVFIPLASLAQGRFELQETNRPGVFILDWTNTYTNIAVNPTNRVTNTFIITNVSRWPAFLLTNIVITNGVTNVIVTTNYIEEQTNMPPAPYFPPPAPKPWWKRFWEWLF